MKTKFTFMSIAIMLLLATNFSFAQPPWVRGGNGGAGAPVFGNLLSQTITTITTGTPRTFLAAGGTAATDGFFGIGNSFTTPRSRLHMHQSGVNFIYTQWTNGTTGNASANDGFRLGLASNGNVEFLQQEGSIFTPSPIRFKLFDGTTMVERMTMLNDGKIGINITNPLAELHVVKIGGSSGTFTFRADAVSPRSLVFTDTGMVGMGILAPTAELHIKARTNLGTAFALKVDDNSNNPLLHIRDDGRVTIDKSTNPFATLDVINNNTIIPDNNIAGNFFFVDNISAPNIIPFSGGEAAAVVGFCRATTSRISNIGGLFIGEGAGLDANYGVQGRANNAGQVTIGGDFAATSPGFTTIGCTGSASGSSIRNFGVFGDVIGAPIFFLSGDYGGVFDGDVFTFGGTNSGTGYLVASDRQLKTDTAAFVSGLGIIRNIHPITYRLNGKAGFISTESNIGVIAQDVASIAPWAVDTFFAKLDTADAEATALLAVKNEAILYTSLNAIKQLDSSVTALGTHSLWSVDNDVIVDNYDTRDVQVFGTFMPLGFPNIAGNGTSLDIVGDKNNINQSRINFDTENGIINFYAGTPVGNPPGMRLDNGQLSVHALPDSINNNDSLDKILVVDANGKIQWRNASTLFTARMTNNGNGQTEIEKIKLTLPDSPVLGVASPNPNAGYAEVAYYLPAGITSAKIIFIDMLGRTMQEKNLSAGYGVIGIDTQDLPNGTYTYTMILNDKTFDTKTMIRTR